MELNVAQVAKRMAEIRTDAVILLGQEGDMKGILTDHDVARCLFLFIMLACWHVGLVLVSH